MRSEHLNHPVVVSGKSYKNKKAAVIDAIKNSASNLRNNFTDEVKSIANTIGCDVTYVYEIIRSEHMNRNRVLPVNQMKREIGLSKREARRVSGSERPWKCIFCRRLLERGMSKNEIMKLMKDKMSESTIDRAQAMIGMGKKYVAGINQHKNNHSVSNSNYSRSNFSAPKPSSSKENKNSIMKNHHGVVSNAIKQAEMAGKSVNSMEISSNGNIRINFNS